MTSLISAVPLVFAVAAPLGAQSTATEGSRFVYVNTQRLLEAAPGAAEAQETWNRELVQMQEEVRKLRVDLDSLIADYRRQESMLSEEARTTRQQELAQKQQELQTRTVQLEGQANERRQALLEPILQRVQAEIEALRAEKGYVMVFDASAAGLVAADSALDVTDEVIARLQAQASAAGAQP
jgi:outer membrane protein